jgi:hypothetical protein
MNYDKGQVKPDMMNLKNLRPVLFCLLFYCLFLIPALGIAGSQKNSDLPKNYGYLLYLNSKPAGIMKITYSRDMATGQLLEKEVTTLTVEDTKIRSTETTYYSRDGKRILKIDLSMNLMSDTFETIKANFMSLPEETKREVKALDVKVENLAVFHDDFILPNHTRYNMFGESINSREKIALSDNFIHNFLSRNLDLAELFKSRMTVMYYDSMENELINITFKELYADMYDGKNVFRISVSYGKKDVILYADIESGEVYYLRLKEENNFIEAKLIE